MLIRNAIRDTNGKSINRVEWIKDIVDKHLQTIKELTQNIFSYKNNIKDNSNIQLKTKINNTIKELQENCIFV